ncbi:hypothetical protein, partial [Phaeospirillum tilakii]
MRPDDPAAPPWRLIRPLWAGLVALAAAAALLLTWVADEASHARLDQLRAARALTLAHSLKEPLEAAISLGLPLDQLPRAQDLLEREQARSGTLSIELFDPQGRVVFGTDRSFLGDLVAQRWLGLAAAAGTRPWQAEEDGSGVVGLPLLNGFGVPVGQLAVRYGTAAAAPLLPPPLLAVAILLLAGAALLLGLTLARAHRPLGRRLARARRALAG